MTALLNSGLTVGVLGAGGFTGGELCRLLLGHPAVGTIVPAGRGDLDFAAAHPRLRTAGLEFVKPGQLQERAEELDVVFFCTPTGEAMRGAAHYLDRGARVIDLSADFRFTDPRGYEKAHGVAHFSPELLEAAVYGVTEVNRAAIREGRLIANPGCYALTAILALLPLLDRGDPEPGARIGIFAVNGTTGAGGEPQRALQQAHVNGSLLAYSLDGHRHAPEIESFFGGRARRPLVDLATAHGPFARGIHLQASVKMATELSRNDVLALYRDRYGAGSTGEPFVVVNDSVRRAGLNDKEYSLYPRIADVVGSNFCHLGVDVDVERRIVRVVAVTDNLIKGAAGSAIQNLNVMLGLDETAGLGGYAV